MITARRRTPVWLGVIAGLLLARAHASLALAQTSRSAPSLGAPLAAALVDSPARFPAVRGSDGALSYTITLNSDDGTEIDRTEWYESGFGGGFGRPQVNRLGRDHGATRIVGLRFHAEDLIQGQAVTLARLRIPAWGGVVSTGARLVIEGVLQPSPTTFTTDDRPSQKLPKTATSMVWEIDETWLEGADSSPLYYTSPPLTGIINEILAQPDWGSGPEGKTLAFTISDNGSDPNQTNTLLFEDSQTNAMNPISTPAVLDVYPTPYDTFAGKELLGRPTDTAVTLNLYPLINMDLYVEYGAVSGEYDHLTPQLLDHPAEQGVDILLNDLPPDARCYYRLAYRPAGDEDYLFGDEHSFHTSRPSGAEFQFAVTADEHIPHKHPLPEGRIELYIRALRDLAADAPDFHISLGDFTSIDEAGSRSIANYQDAKYRDLLSRSFLNATSHSIPFFLVLGNHEGEHGWLYDHENPGGNDEALPVLAARARQEIVPNPSPNEFYSGDELGAPECGPRESYYAWEWGDALFVVLDPYWFMRNCPWQVEDNWEWSLGAVQYDWLYDTLHDSGAKWKFVFIHNLVSSRSSGPGQNYYGRGGVEIAKYKVAQAPSFEWGGENELGESVFDAMRPDFSHGPIHDMLAANDVSIVFHGHDHVFARQNLDGVVYQECPRPCDETYSNGYADNSAYEQGVILPNSGRLRATVCEEYVRIEYVKSYLPGDGENGEVAYAYYVGINGDVDYDGDVDLSDLAALLGSYGQNDGGDIDKDGDTDAADLFALLENYGVQYR